MDIFQKESGEEYKKCDIGTTHDEYMRGATGEKSLFYLFCEKIDRPHRHTEERASHRFRKV
jgi:hypothetical protein